MAQGILLDFLTIQSVGCGHIVVKLASGQVQSMPCDAPLDRGYKGKLVSWDCDAAGVVVRLGVVSRGHGRACTSFRKAAGCRDLNPRRP
jgi:hypothetical protein